MSTPWVVAFGALCLLVLLMLIVVIGVVRRAIAVLDALASGPTNLAFSPEYGGLEPGTPVPAFVAYDRDGREVSSDDLEGSPHVLAFLSAACPPCAQLTNELHRVQDAGELELVVVMEDSDTARAIPFPDGVTVLHQRDRAVSQAFKNQATPQGFAIGSGVVTAVAIPNSVSILRQLLDRAREEVVSERATPMPV